MKRASNKIGTYSSDDIYIAFYASDDQIHALPEATNTGVKNKFRRTRYIIFTGQVSEIL